MVVLTARDLTKEDHKRLRGANQGLSEGDTTLGDLAGPLRALASSAPSQAVPLLSAAAESADAEAETGQ